MIINDYQGAKIRYKGRNTPFRDEIGGPRNSVSEKIVFLQTQLHCKMMNQKIPEYYLTKDNITFYLVFVFFFSLLFVNIFTPFHGAWYNVQDYSRSKLFTDTLIIVSSGTLVLTISKIIMYHVNKRNKINYLQYFSWLIVEVLIIAFLYTTIVHFAVHDTRDFSEIFTRAVIYVPTIIVIPTIISHLYFSTRYKDEKISELESANNQPVAQQTISKEEEVSFANDFSGDDFILDNHVTASTAAEPTVEQPVKEVMAEPAPEVQTANNRIINFFDEKDELQLSLRIDHIYYIESAENYVNIYYKNKENTERFTLRSTLKKQQDKLEKYGFVRCHRSYLVNFANILLLRKDKDGPYLDFGVPNLPQIPVSKTYLDSVTAYFISNSEE